MFVLYIYNLCISKGRTCILNIRIMFVAWCKPSFPIPHYKDWTDFNTIMHACLTLAVMNGLQVTRSLLNYMCTFCAQLVVSLMIEFTEYHHNIYLNTRRKSTTKMLLAGSCWSILPPYILGCFLVLIISHIKNMS